MPRRSVRVLLREVYSHVRLHLAFAWQERERKRAAGRANASDGAPAFPALSAEASVPDAEDRAPAGRAKSLWNALRKRPGMVAAVGTATALLLGLGFAFDRSDDVLPTEPLRDSGLTIFAPAAPDREPAEDSFKCYVGASSSHPAPAVLSPAPTAARAIPSRPDSAVVTADGHALPDHSGPVIVPAVARRTPERRDRAVQPAAAWNTTPSANFGPHPGAAPAPRLPSNAQVRANSAAWLAGTIEDAEPAPPAPAAYAVRSANAYGPARTPRAVPDSVVPTSRPDGPYRR